MHLTPIANKYPVRQRLISHRQTLFVSHVVRSVPGDFAKLDFREVVGEEWLYFCPSSGEENYQNICLDASNSNVMLSAIMEDYLKAIYILGEDSSEPIATSAIAEKLGVTPPTVTSMIEPLMIIIMGSIVGFIAMAIILPIFKLSTMVQ